MFSVHRLRVLFRRVLTFLFTIVWIGTSASAQTAEPLNLENLLHQALSRNPEIAAAAQAWESAKSRIPQAGALSDPMLSFRIQNIGNSPSVGEEEMSAAGLSISQAFPFPGKRSLDEEIARQESERERAMLDESRLRVTAELKRLYFELSFIQQSERVLDEIGRLLKIMTGTARSRYSVGGGIQQDVFRAQTELIRLSDRRIQLEQQEAAVKAAINTAILRPSDSPLGDPQPVRSARPFQTAAEFEAAALARSPFLQASDRTVAVKERMLRRAEKDRLPDFELSLGYFDRGGLDAMVEAMVSFNLPLYYRDKQGARVNEAVTDLAGAREGFSQARQRIRLRVSDLYRELTTSERLLVLIEEGLLPQARLSFESAKSGYEVGKVDFLTLLNNLTALFEDEIGALEMRFRYRKALTEMEELTGLDLMPQEG